MFQFYIRKIWLPFHGHRDDSKHHPKVGEYSIGEVGNFVEFSELNVRDTIWNSIFKNVVKTQVTLQALT